MIRFKGENTSPYDVDDTLVMHNLGDERDIVYIEDPYSGDTIQMRPNRPMIRLLKEEHARGNPVIVWSRGGEQWAYAVVLALKLEDIVSMTMAKPHRYFDDRKVSDWMTDQIYIGPDTRYKV